MFPFAWQTLSTFSKLESRLKAYEFANFIQFGTRETDDVPSGKKCLKKLLKLEPSVSSCIHGGQVFKAKG